MMFLRFFAVFSAFFIFSLFFFHFSPFFSFFLNYYFIGQLLSADGLIRFILSSSSATVRNPIHTMQITIRC
jgi:hypothetical protein